MEPNSETTTQPWWRISVQEPEASVPAEIQSQINSIAASAGITGAIVEGIIFAAAKRIANAEWISPKDVYRDYMRQLFDDYRERPERLPEWETHKNHYKKVVPVYELVKRNISYDVRTMLIKLNPITEADIAMMTDVHGLLKAVHPDSILVVIESVINDGIHAINYISKSLTDVKRDRPDFANEHGI
jgi:hypothetical protein